MKIDLYDKTLLWIILSLLVIGLIMVTSSSLSTGIRLYNNCFYFAKRHFIYCIVSLIISILILNVPIYIWDKYNWVLILISLFSLFFVLFYGKTINGANRWISIGFINIQPSEISKLSLCCYLSSYLSRKSEEVNMCYWGFYKPIIIMFLLSIEMLMQPDLGSVIVIFIITISMLFLTGVKIWNILFIFIIGIFLSLLFVIYEPYRMQRMLSFWNPWNDPFGSGYQLTQSLIACGRGKIFGTGLGNSIQKLEYLPEAHTDFIFSILSEELGYCGVLIIVMLLFGLILKAMLISYKSLEINNMFSGFLSFSIGIWLSAQIIINIGGVIGIIPTKGLTLPLISYGGSSLLIMVISVMLLLRIDFELRIFNIQAILKDNII